MAVTFRVTGIRFPIALVLALFGSCQVVHTQDDVQHPLITAMQKHYFETPKDQEERPTKVTILGTTCNAVIDMTAGIEYTHGKPSFVLEYTKYVSILGHGNPDACLELDVPEIDTKFGLTFQPSNKPDEISFTGEMPAECKDCRPKRAKSISGALNKTGKQRYRLSFTGDLSDSFDLVPKE